MNINVNTQYTIGDTVRVPNAHTTIDVTITDIVVQIGKHGPAFAEINYLTDNPAFESIMEQSIIGKGVAPVIEDESQGYTYYTSNPEDSDFAKGIPAPYSSPFEPPFEEQIIQWQKDEECDECRNDDHSK